jgi:phage terminase large subunit-like protein
VVRQIRGGLEKTPESLLLITTTLSDDIPAGAFKDELHMARRIRDGEFRGKAVRPMLPVLYEFPSDIAKDQVQWEDRANWPIVMPNLGRSVHLASLGADWETEKSKGDHAIRIWASQHLNIEMGLGYKTDRWPGAEFWQRAEDPELSLEAIIERCEAIVVGIDGGGLDDLFGLTVIGREIGTKRWLSWSHAWCHKGVLERRKTIAAILQGLADAGELTIVDDKLEDVSAIVEVVVQINEAGLLACVALDVEGRAALRGYSMRSPRAAPRSRFSSTIWSSCSRSQTGSRPGSSSSGRPCRATFCAATVMPQSSATRNGASSPS